jgi:hypothetical protein
MQITAAFTVSPGQQTGMGINNLAIMFMVAGGSVDPIAILVVDFPVPHFRCAGTPMVMCWPWSATRVNI